jgi:hypothetical protein
MEVKQRSDARPSIQPAMFATRRRLRAHWAARTLLCLGLFGFVIGWAHACAVQQPSQHAGAPAQAEHGSALSGHGQHGLGDAGLHECDAAQESCAATCDEPQGVVPKVESPRALDGAAWPPAIHVFALSSWDFDRGSRNEYPQARISPPDIPVVLRFLRLTL